MTVKKKGKGTLIAIGGNEDRRNKLEVLRRVVEEARGPDTYVEIVTTASSVPRELERTYEKAFKKIGIAHISREGGENNNWIVLDIGDIIVHIFQQEVRDLYRLEELWQQNNEEE